MKKEINNKYNAVWLSHSSISDFLKCERLYFLRNLWKNKDGNKINIVSPSMSLGSAVHQTIEPLALVKTEDRLGEINEGNLLRKFEENWKKFSGLIGGFEDSETEKIYKEEGKRMIKNVVENSGPISRKTIRFSKDSFIPHIYLSEKDNIILCGLVDWVEYLEESDSLRVIDFKTGKKDEKEDSLQLPIYKILVEALQKRKVTRAAYWYLARDKQPRNMELIDEDVNEIKNRILEIGKEIKQKKDQAKTKEDLDKIFTCKIPGGCRACKPFELIKDSMNSIDNLSNVKYLGLGDYNQALYFVKDEK